VVIDDDDDDDDDENLSKSYILSRFCREETQSVFILIFNKIHNSNHLCTFCVHNAFSKKEHTSFTLSIKVVSFLCGYNGHYCSF